MDYTVCNEQNVEETTENEILTQNIEMTEAGSKCGYKQTFIFFKISYIRMMRKFFKNKTTIK